MTSDSRGSAVVHGPTVDTESGPVAESGVSLDADVAIVGAGLSGIRMAIEVQRRRLGSVVLLEASTGLGGTWRDCTYPGVAVDVPSVAYSFSFEGYPWSRVFAPGHEILDYLGRCAHRYGIAPHIRYGARVSRAEFDTGHDRWTIRLADGIVWRARYLVSATGLFSTPRYPSIAGLGQFAGPVIHTARWDHAYAFAGRRIGVIGTGASAAQVVPELAPVAGRLVVFQRTPIWVVPRPDVGLPPAWAGSWAWAPGRYALRVATALAIEAATAAIAHHARIPRVFALAERVVRAWMRRSVEDRATAERLIPRYGFGCKRPAVSNDYLRTFNRPNVRLVTASIARVCPAGILTSDGEHHDLDAIVLGTGYLTTEPGTLPGFEVVGEGGVELRRFWQTDRYQAYGGVSVRGFPNFFLTAGPYAGGFNWFSMLDAHVQHIAWCLERARVLGVTRVQVEPHAHDRYMQQMWRRARRTVFKSAGCATARSYYLDSHGDASLTLPGTPGWRRLRNRLVGTTGYRFGA